MIQFHNSCEYEEDIEEDPYLLEINFDVALRLIQKNERGRQGRNRALYVLDVIKKNMKLAEKRKLMSEGNILNDDDEKTGSIQTIQKVYRA